MALTTFVTPPAVAVNSGLGTNANALGTGLNSMFSEIYTGRSLSYPGSDKGWFEQRLQINGAVGNGTTDDCAAIQNSINDVYVTSKGRVVNLVFPPGLNFAINSACGSVAHTSVVASTCLDIPSSMGMDFNYCTFTPGATALALPCFLNIHGDSTYNLNSYGMIRTQYQNGCFQGPNPNSGNFSYASFLLDDNGGADHGPARICFSHNAFNYFGTNLFRLKNQSYFVSWDYCEMDGGSQTGNLFLTDATGTNCGEMYSLNHCAMFNSGTILRSNFGDFTATACSFDYSKKIIDLSGGTSRFTGIGCHYEMGLHNGNYPASAAYWFDLGTTPFSYIHLIGGEFDWSVLSGNILTAFCNSGTGAGGTQNSNAGIVIDRTRIPYGSNSIPLNDPSATFRFEYNP
jgi:hypothetical protein